MKKLTSALWAVMLTSLLLGCSSPKKRVPADLVKFEEKVTISQVWSKSVGKSERHMMQPVVVGDYVYTSAGNGTVSKLEVLTGKVAWEVKAPGELSAGPGSDGSVTVVGSNKGDVYAFDVDGKLIWQDKVGAEVLTEPLLMMGLAIIRTTDNRFIAYDVKSGKRRWTYVRTQSPLSIRASFAMVPVAADAFVTGFSGGKMGVIAAASGGLLWETSVSFPKGFSEIERMTDVVAAPTLVGRRLCAVAFQGRITCGDLNTGNLLWAKDFSSYSGTAQSQDFVFAADEKSHVVAFRANDGVEVWRNENMTFRDVGAPLAVGRLLIMGDQQGYIHLLDQLNGQTVARTRVDSSGVGARPVVAGGLLIVQSRGGSLAAYQIK